VDAYGNLLPQGHSGELWIGGVQVAGGYLNRPELTASRFIGNPFSKNPGERIYKTGDRVRATADGNLEFLGRTDDQIKIRGYRIEPGEVEFALSQCTGVKQAVVLGLADSNGRMRLVAYIVPEEGFSKESLKDQLKGRVPEYMVPAVFVELASVPLTPNGKTDKKALPDPENEGSRAEEYVAPEGQVEKDLEEIWMDLLKTGSVGIHDNFFEMGGDSIITIQLVSRAKRKGYKLNPYDVFQFPTIAELAVAIQQKKAESQAEQGRLEGEAKLLPIQQAFLEKEYPDKSHYNQAVLVKTDKTLSPELLQKALDAVVQHHDVFRLVFRNESGVWSQHFEAEPLPLETRDLTQMNSDQLETAITGVCSEYQKSLDIFGGKLIRSVLIKTPEAESADRLFIVVHHLVVDGVSWRILMDHLQLAIDALLKGDQPDFGFKTTSYRQFADSLHELAESPQVMDQIGYWNSVKGLYHPLPPETESVILPAHQQRIVVTLDSSLTTSLLLEANQAYATEINDILLSALLLTISGWSGRNSLVIGMEGHGREVFDDEMNLTETAGWFTNVYPLVLSSEGNTDKGSLIKGVKEQIRSLPMKGLGFGILRYLSSSEAVRTSLRDVTWDVIFNYLGQIDNVVREKGWFSPAPESTGSTFSSQYKVPEKLVINSYIAQGVMGFSFSTQDYHLDTISQLANSFVENLGALIEHCKTREEREHSPSDFGLGGLVDLKELDEFLNN
jgi:non-ribosomal peptide synthase protein (TIGR01720 family)